MTDPTTPMLPFEQRLEASFRGYAQSAPIEVDPRSMAAAARQAAAASPAAPRLLWVRPLRWALVAAAIASAAVAATAIYVGSRPPVEIDRAVVTPPAPRHAYTGVFEAIGSVAPGTLATETLVPLADGRVLGLGDGWPDRTPQSIWDPATNRFTGIGVTVGRRQSPIGVLLADGRVLIVGGDIAQTGAAPGDGTATYSTAEVYDPATGTFTATGPMVGRGWGPRAIRLQDGRVLVLDGLSVDDAQAADPTLRTAELYDPATDTWTATGDMTVKSGGANTALLPDGRVLLVGGIWPETNQAEIFDPVTATFSRTADLPTNGLHPQEPGRFWPSVAAAAVPLPDGRVLVPGRHCDEVGGGTNGQPTISAHFDPATETFSATTPMPHCIEQAIALPDGRVFLRSFWTGTTWSGIYDPADGSMLETDPPPAGRYMDAVGLPDGRLLVTANGTVYLFD